MISVVIPLFNKAHTIVNTLTTVINQTYKEFEIIIVNDGSTDNGVEIIQKHFSDERIKIVNQDNAGVSVARNRGVDESNYEYIAFLDGDDEWHPNYLSTMFNLIIKYPDAGLFLCAGLIQNANGSINYRVAHKYEGLKKKINLFENPEVFSHTSGTIVKKTIFNRTHRFIPGMRKFEDYLASQAVALISQTVYCGIPLTKYRGGISGQLTQQNRINPKIIDSEILYFNTIMDDYFKTDLNNKLCPIFIKYFLRHYLKNLIREKKYNKIDSFLNRLSVYNIKLLRPIDVFFLNNHIYSGAILWINITKLIWRLHNFPIVGEKIDTQRIERSFLNW